MLLTSGIITQITTKNKVNRNANNKNGKEKNEVKISPGGHWH